MVLSLPTRMREHEKELNGLPGAEIIGLYAASMSKRLGFYDSMQRDLMDAVKQPQSHRAIVTWAEFFDKSEYTHCSNPLGHIFRIVGLVCPEMKFEVVTA